MSNRSDMTQRARISIGHVYLFAAAAVLAVTVATTIINT